ncbi:MAG: hypothetical protein KatS3mg059_0951 [Thermomicrobiales bacterium]|nr:MAG: hypothetical protein KatS3mg059_0951 [Thermomicrobiales bacterium]
MEPQQVDMLRLTNSSETEVSTVNETQTAKHVTYLLPEVAKLLRLYGTQVTAEIAPCSVGETRVLLYLFHHPSVTLGEVATGTGVAMPTASEVVDRLVDAGLVERETDQRDRRRVVLRLTPVAQETAGCLHAALLDLVQATLHRLDPAEWPGFVHALEVLADELRSRLAKTGKLAAGGEPQDR